MNDFDRCNKISGIYWMKTPIENIKIKVRLKPHEGVIALPKFETYRNSNNSIEHVESSKINEYEFQWQEKVFNLHEIHMYSDVHNCISETDLNYHDMIESGEYQPNKIFTYKHEDCHLPLPCNNKKNKNISTLDILNLNSCFEKLNLGENNIFSTEDSNSMAHLFRSEENVAMDEQHWVAMHVMYDNSDYNEDSQLLLKQEVTLLSLYYNVTQNYLIISPDINDLELNPYCPDVGNYRYAVSIDFATESSDELMTLLNKLTKKWEKKHKQLVKFEMPPPGRKRMLVTFEILSAESFDMEDLYIEFDIKVPEEIQCIDTLHGRTHISECYYVDDNMKWSFGHLVELNLEVDANIDAPHLKIYLEAISKDWWGRQRTEGYSYLPLSLAPGYYQKQLSCSRPEELDLVEAESRRFFVGGCHLIKDLEILAKPQLQDANFKFTSTGSISLRWSVIAQTASPGSIRPNMTLHSASEAILGAERALKRYKGARARLAKATSLVT